MRFLQGGWAVEFLFKKQVVAGANLALISCNICIIKANMFYIDKLEILISKLLWSRFVH